MATPRTLLTLVLVLWLVSDVTQTTQNINTPSICDIGSDIKNGDANVLALSVMGNTVSRDGMLTVKLINKEIIEDFVVELQSRPLRYTTPSGQWIPSSKGEVIVTCNHVNDTIISYPPSRGNKTLDFIWKYHRRSFGDIEITALVRTKRLDTIQISTLKYSVTNEKHRAVRSSENCGAQPCQNAGACGLRDNTEYICQCQDGFIGAYCQYTDKCVSNPCQYDGTCFQPDEGYVCTCRYGYTGVNCEQVIPNIRTCDDRPCKNGGSCYQSEDRGYVCTCEDGYEGVDCEIDLDDSCASNPCVYGTCLLTVRGYLCSCFTGWTGQRCHLEDTDNSPDETTQLVSNGGLPNKQSSPRELNIGVIVGIIVAAVVGVAIGISITLFIYCLRRRNDDIIVQVVTQEKTGPSRSHRDDHQDNEFGMRSYESMSSIDDAVPDHTPAVVLTREQYFNEGADYNVANQTLTEHSLQVHDQIESHNTTHTYRNQGYDVTNANTSGSADITLNITQAETEDQNSSTAESTIDNLAIRSDGNEPFSIISRPD